MSTTIAGHWVFIAGTDGDEDLAARGDRVMNALLDQENAAPGIADSAVAVGAGRRILEIEATATGESLSDAIATGQSAIRAALHTAGIGTPDWPKHEDVMSMVLANLHTEELAPATL
jgi:hypothetical protein